MEFIKSTWRGEKSLPFTYWIIGVVVSVVLNLFSILLEPYTEDPNTSGGVLFFVVFYGLFLLIYTLFAYVAIWRSASNYIEDAKSDTIIGSTSPFWGYVAQIMVAIGVVRFVWIITSDFM